MRLDKKGSIYFENQTITKNMPQKHQNVSNLFTISPSTLHYTYTCIWARPRNYINVFHQNNHSKIQVKRYFIVLIFFSDFDWVHRVSIASINLLKYWKCFFQPQSLSNEKYHGNWSISFKLKNRWINACHRKMKAM